MSNRSAAFLLALLTLVYVLVIYKTLTPSHNSDAEADVNIVLDKDRNEQSTPRSFILPATPAVAEEQERKNTNVSGADNNLCMLKLESIGYQFDSVDIAFNAKYIQAIIDFQRRSGIDISGEIDQQTRTKLGC